MPFMSHFCRILKLEEVIDISNELFMTSSLGAAAVPYGLFGAKHSDYCLFAVCAGNLPAGRAARWSGVLSPMGVDS